MLIFFQLEACIVVVAKSLRIKYWRERILMDLRNIC